MAETRNLARATVLSLACVILVSLCGPARAAPDRSVWVELGTNSGPIPSATRSEPAHLLLWRDQMILIDVGDGAAEQLAKAHANINDL